MFEFGFEWVSAYPGGECRFSRPVNVQTFILSGRFALSRYISKKIANLRLVLD